MGLLMKVYGRLPRGWNEKNWQEFVKSISLKHVPVPVNEFVASARDLARSIPKCEGLIKEQTADLLADLRLEGKI